MALMMDNKPTEYKGEALVWEKLSSLLPNDVVVYNHREVVGDREFDFTLLIKNVGIMIIEVKGWQSQYIFDVKGPDEIVIQGESQIYGSPEKQARGYRFDWLNFLNDQFAISPVVLSMVCYPFISEKEYEDVRLDIVSSRNFTIFSDDLNSATKLGQKISNAFVKKKPLNSTPFDEKAMAIVRQHFEPSYKAKDDQIIEVSDAYSLLKVFSKELTERDSDELIEMYFAGTKIVTFVKNEIDLLSVCNKLEAGFNARGIISDKGNVRLAEVDERNDFSGVSGSYRIFNFEIYTYNLDLNNDEIIVEGQYTEQQKLILEDVANSTSWNFDQYKVEHAMGDKNVLVQAGAGTGKTYSMVSRIAYLCMPRELEWKDGKILQHPLKEMKDLRKNAFTCELEAFTKWAPADCCFELRLDVEEAKNLELKLREDVTISWKDGLFTLSMGESGRGRKQRFAKVEELSDITIFSDTSAIEIFINNGETVLTTRVYSEHLEQKVELVSREVKGSVHGYELGSFEVEYKK